MIARRPGHHFDNSLSKARQFPTQTEICRAGYFENVLPTVASIQEYLTQKIVYRFVDRHRLFQHEPKAKGNSD